MGSCVRAAGVVLCVCASVIAAVGVACVVAEAPAFAAARPSVTMLSQHRGAYWGATRIVVRGTNFVDVTKVVFGTETGYALEVLSPTKLAVIDPEHNYGTVHVRVITSTGISVMTPENRF